MRVLQNRHRNVYSICTWKIWIIDFIKNVAKWKGSYKPCSNTCSPTPTQTHPYSSLTSQQMVILTHNHPENVTPTHIHSHPAKNWSHPSKKSHTLPHITERKNVMCLIHDTYVKSIPFPQYLKKTGLFIFFYWILETTSESIFCLLVFNN